MSKQTTSDTTKSRAVAADESMQANLPAATNEVLSCYTVTRAFRGPLVAQNEEFLVLWRPAIVWTADPSDVNHRASNYFVTGLAPSGYNEEPSGASLAIIAKGAMVHACAHGVEGDVSGAREAGPRLLVDGLLPKPGTQAFFCAVTHEFLGTVGASNSEMVVLEDGAMVNEIADGHFAACLAGAEKGRDHVDVAGVRLYWHALAAVLVR